MPCQNPSAVQTEQGSFMRPRGCSHLQTQPRRHSPLLLRKCTNTKYSLATRLRNRATGRGKSHGICPFSSFKNVTIYPCLWHEANYQSDVFRSSTDPHDSPVKYLFCYYYTYSSIWGWECLGAIMDFCWSENNLEESVLAFYHVGPKDWIQVWWQTPLPTKLSQQALSKIFPCQSQTEVGVSWIWSQSEL